MSHMREVFPQLLPTASVWKASKYRLVGDPGYPEYVEAETGATWARVDPFESYKPPVGRDLLGPHVFFAKLADMAREWDSPRKRNKTLGRKLFNGILVLADKYGLLGLYQEAFAEPVLPRSADPLISWVAPDARIVDGKLRPLDPKTEGKRYLEEQMNKHNKPPQSGRPYMLKRKHLTWPSELRFPARKLDFGWGLGPLDAIDGWGRLRVARHDEIRERFGIRFVLDERAHKGVSAAVTREPVDYWMSALRDFDVRIPPAHYSTRLEGVSPRGVAGEDGSLASSWSCPSLLKALYLMVYLDNLAGAKLQKCQAPGCPEYYRPGSRSSMYCPRRRARSKASALAGHPRRCSGSASTVIPAPPDTTLTPPGTQYGATTCKTE